ncbi:MAG: DUF1667 domain-containing protein [Ruminococcaceae bacterium]|nr:DUF1667 domain-containing protein [Oscillospiraceae bacterium]
MTRELTCIVCPRGCSLKAELTADGKIESVEGFACPRGKQYAIDECTHPMRTVTSTVRATNGDPVPVKTSKTIPKELIFDCMKEINAATVTLPTHIGDVVIPNFRDTGADVIVTAERG